MKRIKYFFETPKKTILSIICTVAILGILGFVIIFAKNNITEDSSLGDRIADDRDSEYGVKTADRTTLNKAVSLDEEKPSVKAQITLDEAKEAALKDAGLAVSEVTFTQTQLDIENGISIYEIEFYAENAEYEYEINADTGAVYSKSKETYVTHAAQKLQDETQKSTEITEQQSNARKNTQHKTEGSDNPIGVDSAKSIAVGHAGFDISDVTFSKAKLEKDDGQTVYEVEFYKDGIEYEYTINAVNGSILEYDVD